MSPASSHRQVNARLKKTLSKTEMYNFSHYIHMVRFAVREYNSGCIAKVRRFQESKLRANAGV